MRRAWYSVAILVVAIVLAAAASQIPGILQPRMSTTGGAPAIFVGSGKAGVANSISGLQLGLSLNETQIRSGQAVLVQVYEYNPSNALVNESASSSWASRIIGIGVPPCTFENEPVSLAVMSGYYSAGNFSAALPLQLVNDSAVYSCPPPWTAIYWAFQPMSNTTQLNGCLPGAGGRNDCSDQGLVFPNQQAVPISGTFSIGNSPTFQALGPGVYTVLAGDEWGAAVILHFRVT